MQAKFDTYIQARGSSGRVKFDHRGGRLEMEVQVDNRDKNTVSNDISNLSGGERSFVNFSLQLALGHVVSFG